MGQYFLDIQYTMRMENIPYVQKVVTKDDTVINTL